MSKELIERLRADAESTDDIGLCADAADRIEELERERDALQADNAELVAALEDNWNCNPCETTRQQKAFDVAQSVLAKVRKP